MKKLARICLAFSLFAAAVMPVFAQTSVETASAASYKANWGKRDVVCTSLSSDATSFYKQEEGGLSYAYEDMILKSGGSSSSVTSAPTSQLYKALQKMMRNEHHTITTYDGTRELYKYTDCVEGDTSKLSRFYYGDMKSSTWDSGNTYNREHVWPKSKGNVPNTKNEKNDTADIMTLRPTDADENSRRGNKAYGRTTDSNYYYPNKCGQNVIGDCARMLLYTYVRWENDEGKWGSGNVINTMWGSDGVIESKQVLLQWMKEDPVDTWEMGRNDAVQSITGTRNVFVDYPEYAWLMFGESVPTDMVTPSGKASNGTATPENPGTTPDDSDTPTETPANPTTQKEIVDAAYALDTNETLGSHTLTGKITNVKEYDTKTTNICLTIQVEGKDFYCYWMRDNASGDNKNLAVGDTITVTGTIKNYKGTVEFDQPTLGTVIKANSGSTPNEPNTPSEPSEPSEPTTPSEPSTPSEPTTPENPTTPEDPSVDEEIRLPEVGENGCEHEFGEWFVITPATTEEEGEKACYCNKCGEEYKAKIPVLTEEEKDSSNLMPEPSVDNNGMLGNLTAGCESSVGVSLAGMSLLAVGVVLFKRKENE